MALFYECIQKCARKPLDTADIVREGDVSRVKAEACFNSVVRIGFTLLDYYPLVINRQRLDRCCGVVNNHQLEVFDFFTKASRLPPPQLGIDNKRNAGRNCASLQRGNKTPSA